MRIRTYVYLCLRHLSEVLYMVCIFTIYIGDVTTVPVYFRDDADDLGGLGHPNPEALDQAYESAVRNGMPPKALLITNPNNPSGEIYSAAELRLMARWCDQKKIHLISDEIYALSVFPDQCMYGDDNLCLYAIQVTLLAGQGGFVSIASALEGNLG